MAQDRCEPVQVEPKIAYASDVGLTRACCLLAIVAACHFDEGVGNPNTVIDGSMADVPDGFTFMDAPGDARQCFGTFINICLTSLPTTDVNVETDREVNTDTGCPFVFTQPSGPTLCGVVGKNVTVNARLRGIGPRPLVVLATDTVTISGAGVIDVGSYRETTGTIVEIIGAGASSGATLCGSPSNGGNDVNDGGGGAGGTFVGKGGVGARGANGAGGAGATPANSAGVPTFLRGGCRGTSGGGGAGNIGGAYGFGGGAVLVLAGNAISNAGHIRAGGMGGYGGGTQSGGGGGGSGGMIVLDAATITNSGILNANGGGGGEGGGMMGGQTASSAFAGTTAAVCNNNNVNGGDGGDGSWASALDGGPGGQDTNGGGAGGGGAGAIRIYPAQTLGGIVSPNPS